MKKIIVSLVLSILISNITGQQLKIYIANDNHDDLMWTANENTYVSSWIDMLDYYLNLADTHQSEADDYQSRFTADGTLWVWNYEQAKTTAEFNRLMNRIKDGHISVPKNPTTMNYGSMNAEAVIRSMFYAGELERRFDLQLPLAIYMENQTNAFGLPSLWAGSGCKYSWRGVCNCATQVTGLYNAQREHDIYWWTGLDDQRILLKWNSFTNHIPPGGSGPNQSIGGYAEAWDPADVVEYVYSNSTFKSRYPYNIIGAFGKGWDDLSTKTDQFITVAKDKTNANRQVIVSNEIDFFKDFESTYGSSLSSYNASFGNEWEIELDVMAEVSGNVRRTIEKMRTAEALASYASLLNQGFMDPYKSARRKAWIDLGTYFNHDWFPYGSITASDLVTFYKAKAASFTNYVNTLLNDAANLLSSQIKKSGTNTRFYVFNPLSWSRTDFVDYPYSNSDVHVMDISSNTEVPSHLVIVDGAKYLRILASDVPAVGYKVYEIVNSTGASFPVTATVTTSGTNRIIENDYYKITFTNRGAITSLIDKTRSNKEFVSGSLNDLGSSSGTLIVENNGPVSATVVATASSPLSHQTRITLYKNINRIDIKNEITQNFNGNYSWGYSFNLTSPQLWHEELGAIIKAALLANGGHYSPKFARYDWFTMNHFADISGNDNTGMTISNADCMFFKYGNSTTSSLDAGTSKISILAGCDGDIKNQGGDTHFLQRFSLKPHDAYNQASAMKFSLEHQNPFYAKEISGGNSLPENSCSLISISDPNVLLWALKPAEDGIGKGGIIARVWNINSSSTNFNISSPDAEIQSGKILTHVETPISDATVSSGALVCSANKHQMKTYSLVIHSKVLDGIEQKGSSILKSSPFLRPNPAENQVEIMNLSGIGTIKFISLTGQLVKTFNYSGNSTRIDLSGFDKGIYLINIATDKNNYTNKLVIK